MKSNRNTKAALIWIVSILRKYKVPFQISGGLAARLYGSKRRLADIDIEIPENAFRKILPDVKKYVKYGPAKFKNKEWELMLMTLKYKGQVIDFGGAYRTKIFNQITKKWDLQKSKFSKAKMMRVYGIVIPVISKKLLLEYKKKLKRDVDLMDVSYLIG